MPITLLTGLPGHGKTLEAVRMMRDDYPDRKIYAANFPGLAYDFLGVEEFDPLKWAECEAGSILFIDEAWEYFEARGPHKMPPDVIKELARHRHYGLDLVLICQGPFQLDSHLRSLIETHLHIIRPFGMKYYIIRNFRGVEARPDDRHARKNTADTSTRRKHDKTLFDFYKSAEVHTIKRKLPFKAVGAAVVLLGLVFAIWNMLAWAKDFVSTDKNQLTIGPDGERVDPSFNPLALPLPPDLRRSELINIGSDDFTNIYNDRVARYYLGEKELVAGAPWTAPKWLEIMEPVTFPKPVCMFSEDQELCICHSQQGTVMNVDYDICTFIAQNGWFDPTLNPADREDRRIRAGERYLASLLEQEKEKELESTEAQRTYSGTTLPYILERLRDHKKSYKSN